MYAKNSNRKFIRTLMHLIEPSAVALVTVDLPRDGNHLHMFGYFAEI